MRLFFALELPAETKRRLYEQIWRRRDWWGIDSASHLHIVPEENLHITVKFLDEVPVPKLPAIKTAVAELPRIGSLDLRSETAGFFPPHRNARVFVAHFAGDAGRIERLHQNLESAMEPLGFARETRPLQLHVTLARSRDRRGMGGVSSAVKRNPAIEPIALRVDSLTLFHSDLSKDRPVYTAGWGISPSRKRSAIVGKKR